MRQPRVLRGAQLRIVLAGWSMYIHPIRRLACEGMGRCDVSAIERMVLWASGGVRWPGLAPAGDLLSCLCKKDRQRSTPHCRGPSGSPPSASTGRAASQTRPAGSDSEAAFSAPHLLRSARQRGMGCPPATAETTGGGRRAGFNPPMACERIPMAGLKPALQSAPPPGAGEGKAEPACLSPSVPPNGERRRRELSCRLSEPAGRVRDTTRRRRAQ